MSIIWWIFLPPLYLLIAALVKIFAARAQADEQMTSEGLATLHFGETGFVTDDGEGNVSWEPVNIPLGPGPRVLHWRRDEREGADRRILGRLPVKPYLFVGGPQDGRVKSIDFDRCVVGIPDTIKVPVADFDPSAPVSGPVTVRTHAYFRMQFSGVLRKVFVYAHESLNPDDVLDALIANYKAPK